MRWRMMAAEETWRMEQRTSKYSQWWRGNNDSDNNNKTQQSTNFQWQRQRTCAAAEAEDNNSWQEVGCSGGGRGATVMRQRRRNSFKIRPWRMEVDEGWGGARQGVHFFSFLGGDESYLQSYPL
jgi:hypothetical protein